MDSCVLSSPRLNPCFTPLYPPCWYSPPLRLSTCYSRRLYSPVTVNAAKKLNHNINSEFDDRINGALSPDSDSRFLDRVIVLFLILFWFYSEPKHIWVSIHGTGLWNHFELKFSTYWRMLFTFWLHNCVGTC